MEVAVFQSARPLWRRRTQYRNGRAGVNSSGVNRAPVDEPGKSTHLSQPGPWKRGGGARLIIWQHERDVKKKSREIYKKSLHPFYFVVL